MNKKALDEKYSYQINEYNNIVHLFRGEDDCQQYLTNPLLSAIFKIETLEKENAELDCQKIRNRFCYSCANATERCFRNEIGCPCEKYKSYKDENSELKKINADGLSELNHINGDLIIENEKLRKEKAELKETLKTYNGCGDWDNDFHTCRVYLQREELQKCVEQLTKAKTYLKYFIEILKKLGANKEPLVIEAEQFLKDSEVEE